MATISNQVVESVARTGKSIKIGGQWYGAFAASQLGGCGVGDTVSFTYNSVEKAGTTYHNIKGNVTKSGGAAAAPAAAAAPRASGGFSAAPARSERVFPVPPLSPERSIIRQNALGHATRLVIAGADVASDVEAAADMVITIARKFEAYACGDLDLAEAESLAAKMLAESDD